MTTPVEELSNCYEYFLRLSGLPDLFGKLFLVTFDSPKLISHNDFLEEQLKQKTF